MVNYAKGFSLPPVKGNILVAIYRSGGRAVVAADMAHAYSSLLERKGTHRLAHAVWELAARYNRHCCGTGNRSPCAPSPKARKSSPLRRPGVSYLQ